MCNINYTELILNEKNVLDYALKFSDFFSIIVICKKPYSKIPPNFEYESVAKKLNPFLVKYIFDRNEWPVKYLSRSKHQVMVFYKSCKESRQIMSEQPNWFLSTQNNLPEDICFYRKEEAWLVTISHEKLAYITNPTKQDIAFLKQNNTLYCEGSPMSQYKLPKE